MSSQKMRGTLVYIYIYIETPQYYSPFWLDPKMVPLILENHHLGVRLWERGLIGLESLRVGLNVLDL